MIVMDVERRVLCPKCVEAGQKSRVYIGSSVSTLLAYSPFYDEEGRLHSHDSNTVSTSYRCSKGHGWWEDTTPSCWCGWPENQREELREPVPASYTCLECRETFSGEPFKLTTRSTEQLCEACYKTNYPRLDAAIRKAREQYG